MISVVNKFMYPSTASAASAALGSSSGAPSDTQSEISSTDSDWSDIKTIANKLGITNPEELYTERFKVDRQKLEQMIKAESYIQDLNGAQFFFENVSKKTEVHISWPCRLKIGAKSKKDPHVRIVGKSEKVAKAKELVLASLDSKGTRVIMKMDVSYTDHSYIIGRGGNNIKRIMEETSTHIHFPDSNRSSSTEKSNQVSLCGSLEGVEKARALVRLSTPLLMSYELPVMPMDSQPDRTTPYVELVEQKYNVQVIFSSRPKLHSSLVLVKGAEKDAEQVQEATQTLIKVSCGDIASQILVHMQLEISPQHHEIVKGRNNANLLSIMERTQTKIIFPDLKDMNVKPLKKSQVNIIGTINGVYKARQQLIGNLPIALIFDFPDNENEAAFAMSLRPKDGVYIGLRQKQRQSGLAIVVKSLEKFIDKAYQARHDILSLTTPLVVPEIPETYFMPQDKGLNVVDLALLSSLLEFHAENQRPPKGTPNWRFQSSDKVNTNKNNNNNNDDQKILNEQQQNKNPYDLRPTPSQKTVCLPTEKYLQMHNNNLKQQHQQQQEQQAVSTASAISNLNSSYLQMLPPQPPMPSNFQRLSPRNSFSNNTSGYQSYSSSTTSLEQAYPPFGLSGAHTNIFGGQHPSTFSPDSNYSSQGAYSRVGRRSSDGVLLGLNNSSSSSMLSMTPNSAESYRNLHYDPNICQRTMGYKAMERLPMAGELRTPNANWMGMGLSGTSPAHLETVNNWPLGAGILNSPYNLGTTTGVIDATPTNRRLQLHQCNDMQSLLVALGLEHYIKIFLLNEIDMDIFRTLTEENLIELGIAAFGARKKLLVAIHTLQTHEAANSFMPCATSNNSSPRFSGSAAPGAERRPSNQW
uniref:SAM domain-containing protein n=1 Tax=Glossina brevipalpis TaxID=37001 RepID=A0A1A9WTZ7_9MUSC